jgi:hypothetical protein
MSESAYIEVILCFIKNIAFLSTTTTTTTKERKEKEREKKRNTPSLILVRTNYEFGQYSELNRVSRCFVFRR